MDYWLNSYGRKIYLFDEAIEATQRRRAMSNLNVEWIRRIPQLSKSRCHLIVITQETQLTESAFFNWTFLRGVWNKLNKTTVTFFSQYIFGGRVLRWVNIPRTTIKFDPYRIATFTQKPSGLHVFADPEKALLWEWANGKTYKELGLHNMELNRLLRKYLRFHLESQLKPELHVTHT